MLLEFEDGPLPGEAPPVGDGLTAVMIPVAVSDPNELAEASGPGVRPVRLEPAKPRLIRAAFDTGKPDSPPFSAPPKAPGPLEAAGPML